MKKTICLIILIMVCTACNNVQDKSSDVFEDSTIEQLEETTGNTKDISESSTEKVVSDIEAGTEKGTESVHEGNIVEADNGDGTYSYTMFYENGDNEYLGKFNYRIYNKVDHYYFIGEKKTVNVKNTVYSNEIKSEELFLVGLVDENFNEVIPTIMEFYVDANFKGSIKDGYIIARQGSEYWEEYRGMFNPTGKYCVYNTEGELVLQPQYDSIEYLGEGKFNVKKVGESKSKQVILSN